MILLNYDHKQFKSLQFKVFSKDHKMSYTRQLLYSIADEMGRSRNQMEGFISILEKNWYDSKQSLKSLGPKDYQKFQIPGRLGSIITEKVQDQQKRSKNSMQMEVEFSVHHEVSILKKQLNQTKFDEIVDSLFRVFCNIRNNITQEKYRILKKNNKKIAAILQYSPLVSILKYGGFQDQGDKLILRKIDLAKLDECIDGIVREHAGSKFDPYKAQMVSLQGNRNLQLLTQQKQSETSYNDKLAQLQKQRQVFMSKPIKDRQVKIYQIEKIKQTKGRDTFMQEQRELNQDQQVYMQKVKQFLKKQGQDPKFLNRRKAQYFQLMKKPCFSQTLIRVKLPDNWIFQCKFSPMQTLQVLVKIFDEYVENKKLDYYLYMTPPVQKLRGMILRNTFYDLGCVPKAIFYFGSEQTITKNPLKVPNKGFFGIF